MENVIKTESHTIIFNGGNPLEGCPKDWCEAKDIETHLNKDSDDGYPKWKFDCGFKLDFDGSLISICSRFYPPTTHGGNTWDGKITVSLLGNKIASKELNCKTIEQLHSEAKGYVDYVISKIKSINLHI